ncbi:TonB-dependent receptor [Mucilaginibacter sp. Bleaf8]|uniref:SusC/RagA family TonB-linked outer membrane protein n=1 Tax=Mucilaginibacter sp. Bleaf8 TaxID=2834430 RepID=UPI001BCF213D|nr:TonB-dependent receptor [Mucilaginibacter sp. Bleaf8]MBS7563657.1 TonB-dependent receptor [Mucilaginibacter sp. Bleaf8]
MQKTKLKHFIKVFMMVGLMICPVIVFAQNRKVTGKVLDEKGLPLPGATVRLKTSGKSVAANVEGAYSIEVPANENTLVVSFVGYPTQEILIKPGVNVYDVPLRPDAKSLTEVVVVGYGTQRRSDVTGSIASVNEKALREVPVSNLGQALQGRAAGISVTNTSSRPGDPGRIRIRGERSLTSGANDPLIVVDGIIFTGSLNDINPNDIKSIDVLKDASATAIYGSRGSNGVIIVTTQRGRTGETTISYNGYYGFGNVMKKYPVLNGDEFRAYRDLANSVPANGSTTPNNNFFYLPQEQQSIANGTSTDWQDLLYKTARQQDHQVTVSGGTEQGQYSIGGGYFDQTTVVPGQEFQRYALRASVDAKIGKRIKVGLSTQNTFTQNDGENVNLMFGVLSLSPLVPAYDANGNVIAKPAAPREDQFSPLLVNNRENWAQRRKRISTFNSLYGEVQILEGLKYRINIGARYVQDQYGSFQAPVSAFSPATQTYSQATVSNNSGYDYTIENLLYYDKTIAEKHKINVTALYSLQEQHGEGSYIQAQNILANYLQYNNLGQSDQPYIVPASNNNQYTQRDILSYMLRVNYNFNERFLLTLTGRADGSSVLAPGKKWNYYPAVSAGWNITNESFMKSQTYISNLKLRAGWGQTSNQAINPYATLGLISQNYYNSGTAGQYGYYLSNLTNPNLGWEYSKTINAGIDFGFWDNRLTGSIDLYRQRTFDILLPQQLPATTGVPGSFLNNIGRTENKGIEISLSAQVLQKKDGFNWGVDVNWFLNRNKILALQNGVTQDVANGWFVGQPIDVAYDNKKLGIWQTNEAAEAALYNQKPGQIKALDLNGDRKIDANDRTLIGNYQARFEGGITNRFTYKNFDLSVVANGRYGGLLYSAVYNPQSYFYTINGRHNVPKVNYWTPSNPTNDFPMPDATQGDLPQIAPSSLAYFDASYLHIRSINFGYTFTDKLIRKIGGKSLRVYATCNNVGYLFSPYMRMGGVSPEPNRSGGGTEGAGIAVQGRQLTVGVDVPPVRTFIFGVNVRY